VWSRVLEKPVTAQLVKKFCTVMEMKGHVLKIPLQDPVLKSWMPCVTYCDVLVFFMRGGNPHAPTLKLEYHQLLAITNYITEYFHPLLIKTASVASWYSDSLWAGGSRV
jgi:hypothetical protein